MIEFINEIKEGMVIYCANEDEVNLLLSHLDELGYKWNEGYGTKANRILKALNRIVRICEDGTLVWDSMENSNVAFIDLIDTNKEYSSYGKWEHLDGDLFKCECGYVTNCATTSCSDCGKEMY